MTVSQQTSIKDAVELLDKDTVAIYISCPSMHIVQLQSYFEIFESVGIVRTLDSKSSMVCILTTPSMEKDCHEILQGLSDKISWQYSVSAKELLNSRLFNDCVE
jgi:hypothetical protein